MAVPTPRATALYRFSRLQSWPNGARAKEPKWRRQQGAW